MATAHIEAKKGEIAKIVLMAGDPLRAKLFSETYLTDIKRFNTIRNMFGYTGITKKGKKISVMGHGMGLESVGIYSYELYKFYDVDTIIRFGSAGAYDKNLDLLDIVIAEKAWTESNYGIAFGNNDSTASADPDLVKLALQQSKELNYEDVTNKGTINSSMWFYQTHNIKSSDWFVEQNILAAEMEAYALYSIAKELNKKALTILTISDHIALKKELKADERRTAFTKMFNLVLKMAENL